MIANPKTLQAAADQLSKNDPVLAVVIVASGLPDIEPSQDYYQKLVDSIISQQLSVKAARSIERRFCELFGDADNFPLPEAIMTKSVEEMRTTGLSNAKARYVRDLAQHVIDGKLKFDHFGNLSNDEIIAELTAVKGIGEWTAHMFLMFCMGRLDILPVGDLGIRNGVQKLYGFEKTPSPQEVTEIAKQNHWHPYESVASWYIWHSLDNVPA